MTKTKRYTTLDSLRGIASLIVVIFHIMISYTLLRQANYFFEFENEFLKWLTVTPLKIPWSGMEAVLLFFVLSGFVLSLPYWNRDKTHDYKAYLIKRFCRIYIPFVLIMLISSVLVNLFYQYRDIAVIGSDVSSAYLNRWSHETSWTDILSFIFMINVNNINNVNGVVWTLYHEMRISILLPFFFIIMQRFRFIKSFFIVMGTNFVIVMVLLIGSKISSSTTLDFVLKDFASTFYYCCFFLFGSYLAKHINKFAFIKDKGRTFKLALLVASLFIINPNWFLYLIGINNVYVGNFISLFGILTLFILAIYSDSVVNFLNKKSLLWLGKTSFSLYMIHIPIIMFITTFATEYISLIGAFIVSIIVSLVLSEYCYRFIEIPSMNLGKKLSFKYLENKGKRIVKVLPKKLLYKNVRSREH